MSKLIVIASPLPPNATVAWISNEACGMRAMPEIVDVPEPGDQIGWRIGICSEHQPPGIDTECPRCVRRAKVVRVVRACRGLDLTTEELQAAGFSPQNLFIDSHTDIFAWGFLTEIERA